jgi:hypothetical protein
VVLLASAERVERIEPEDGRREDGEGGRGRQQQRWCRSCRVVVVGRIFIIIIDFFFFLQLPCQELVALGVHLAHVLELIWLQIGCIKDLVE